VDAVTVYQSWSVLDESLPSMGVASAIALAVARVLFGSTSVIFIFKLMNL
jgi:hypothetical protein